MQSRSSQALRIFPGDWGIQGVVHLKNPLTIAEAIQLAAPIAPVCRPACRGLCPECGGDLNAAPHDHGEAPVDPRLAMLRELLVDDEG